MYDSTRKKVSHGNGDRTQAYGSYRSANEAATERERGRREADKQMNRE